MDTFDSSASLPPSERRYPFAFCGFNRADVCEWRHRSPAGLTDIDVVDVDDGFERAGEKWTVSALPTDHAYMMDVYAYRFDEHGSGDPFVYSADTTPMDAMVEFASGADVLVHDCNITGETEEPLDKKESDNRYFRPPYVDYLEWVFGDDTQEKLTRQLHTSASEAGNVAERAGVDKLVLTHFNPLRDLEAVYEEATRAFPGEVLVAEDGLAVL